MYKANNGCTNHGVVPLPITFATEKFCENFTNEDNFNNTFSIKSFRTTAAVAERWRKVSKKMWYLNLESEKSYALMSDLYKTPTLS